MVFCTATHRAGLRTALARIMGISAVKIQASWRELLPISMFRLVRAPLKQSHEKSCCDRGSSPSSHFCDHTYRPVVVRPHLRFDLSLRLGRCLVESSSLLLYRRRLARCGAGPHHGMARLRGCKRERRGDRGQVSSDFEYRGVVCFPGELRPSFRRIPRWISTVAGHSHPTRRGHLGVSGWLGGELVSRYGVSVHRENES